jgi:hypothetical protein
MSAKTSHELEEMLQRMTTGRVKITAVSICFLERDKESDRLGTTYSILKRSLENRLLLL